MTTTTPMLTVPEVAARLNVKERTAYAMLQEGGSLHYLRREFGGRTIRVDADDLERHIKQGTPTHATI